MPVTEPAARSNPDQSSGARNPNVPTPSSPPPASYAAPASPMRARQPTIPPSALDELEERYAAIPEGSFAPEQAIDSQISDLEAWTLANVRAERRELVRFWLLRGLGFVGAAAGGMAGFLEAPHLALACGTVAALAIAIDAAYPASSERTARRRAIHDLRELQHTLKLKWDKVRLAHPDKQSLKRVAHALALLDSAQAKREEIGRYLGDATPGVSGGVSS